MKKRNRLMLVGTVAPDVIEALDAEVDSTGLTRSAILEKRLREAYGLPVVSRRRGAAQVQG